MRVPRIYQAVSLSSDLEIELDATASQHLIKVLRLREGDTVIVFDGLGESYQGELMRITGKVATVRLRERIAQASESPLQLHVGLGISKGERMDYAIQKLVETGVHAIAPLRTEHTVVRLDARREQTRLQHWQGIITSACEQCGRSFVPRLHGVSDIYPWIASTSAECKLVFDATGTIQLRDVQPIPQQVCVLIGPEGGLSEKEVNDASHHGFHVVRLGPRILRTETAAVAISAALQTLWGDY